MQRHAKKARQLPQKQLRSVCRRQRRTLQSALRTKQEQQQLADIRQTQQSEEQTKLMHSQNHKQQHAEQAQLAQRANDERHHHIQNQIRNSKMKLSNQRTATGKPKMNSSAHASDSNRPDRPNSEPPDGQVRKKQFHNRIRAGLRSLLTFPTKQIKSLFGDGVT